MRIPRLPTPAPGDFPVGYDEAQWSMWRCPRNSFDVNIPGVGLACLASHQITEHADGTMTANPSILVSSPHRPQAHGYIEHDVWRDC
jgi:hypothetical protein